MKEIISTLNTLQSLADHLEAGSVSAIERDLALEKLRNIYDSILSVEDKPELQSSVIELIEELVEEVEEFDNSDEEVQPEPEVEESVIELIEELVEEVEEFDNSDEDEQPETKSEPEPENKQKSEEVEQPRKKLAHAAILALYGDDDENEDGADAPAEAQTEQPSEEPIAELNDDSAVSESAEEDFVIDMVELQESEEEPMSEVEIEKEPESVVEIEPEPELEPEPEPEPEPEMEPESESVLEPDSDTAPAQEFEPIPAPAPEEETKVVLGDVLGGETITIGEAVANELAAENGGAPADVATVATASKLLVEMIGVNDRFVLLRDMFQNNTDLYEAAIDQLDEFDNLEDAMLFIYDNLHYNPHSEGAKLLVDLISRKHL